MKIFHQHCLGAVLCAGIMFFGAARADSAAIAPAGKGKPLLSGRIVSNLNAEWKFKLGSVENGQAVDLDDSQWELAHVPHSFSLPYFLSDRFYTGDGWYRKKIHISNVDFVIRDGNLVAEPDKRYRYYLDFKGVFQVADVYVNGKLAGHHEGGYTGFEVDFTDQMVNGENLIAVRVNNNWNPRIAPRAGEHTFSGGIYRDVSLVVKRDVHVAWYGMSITTPKLEDGDTSVRVVNEIRNQSDEERTIDVETSIYDPSGALVAKAAQKGVVMLPNAVREVEIVTPQVKDAKWWSPETPNLYRAETTVVDANTSLFYDRFSDNFGFRTIKWTADQGFFLNGKNRYFHGANVHQDRAGWGDAVSHAGFERDVRYMKEAGFDFIRGCHYPHHPAFADACDRIGMMFWSENCFWGTTGMGGPNIWGGASAYPVEEADQIPFEESVIRSLRDMIRINRNHPSIVCWSLCNEVFFSDGRVLPKVRDFLQRLTKIAHEADPTRPAAVGGAQRGQVDHCSDIAGYNGDGERIREYQNPGLPNVVSEYGSNIELRPGKFDAGYEQFSRITGKKEYSWRSGEVIWCGIDHGSMGGRFGWMGVMDYFRLPKRRWYYYRETLGGVKHPEWPVEGTPAKLALTSDKNSMFADGTDDVQLIATVLDASGRELSNSPDVTFRVVSGPGEFPTGRSITFKNDSDIAIRDGKCSIDFRSYYSGVTVIEATSPGLESARVEITSTRGPGFEPGRTPVIESRPYIKFSGELIGTKPVDKPVNMALDKPTLASESVAGHSALCAVDGRPETFYQAKSGENCFLQVSSERIIRPDSIRVVFSGDAKYSFKVECSVDQDNWAPVAACDDVSGEKVIPMDRKFEALFYRITFAASDAAKPGPAVSEFEIILKP
jgi:hypothetical protein